VIHLIDIGIVDDFVDFSDINVIDFGLCRVVRFVSNVIGVDLILFGSPGSTRRAMAS
jgi:hypothetical protein